MKKSLITIFLTISTVTVFSQNHDTVFKTYQDVNDLKKQLKSEDVQLFKYIDSTFKYEVNVPSWLTLRETGNPELWGGTLPAINGIENAILITGFNKKEFKSFQEFKNKIIEANVLGKPTQMSNNHIFMGKKDLPEIEGIGPAYKQYHMWNNMLYDCQFVLTETKTAFIWINFTATRETYDKNLEKFMEFIKGFRILEN